MKNVIISGGTRGLGLAITKRLCAERYRVFAIGRECSEDLEALTKDPCISGQAHFVKCDLADLDAIKPMVAEIYHGYGPLYGLVNNAAIARDGILCIIPDSHIEELITLNLTSPILLTKFVSRFMLLNSEGRIVNISSIIAKTGFNGLSIYGASKSGLLGFSHSLARELGKAQITVNTVLPGYMKTEMTSGLDDDKLGSITRRSALGRLATTEDVAAVVAFLLSPEAGSITGGEFTVDAGSTA